MPHLLIYSSPADHDSPAAWYRYRDRIRETLEHAGVAASIAVDDEALFAYGADVESVIARVNDTQPGRGQVVVAQWSTIVFYSAAAFFLGDDVNAGAVRDALSAEPFLKEHAGEYSLRTASCYAYERYPYGDDDVPPTRRIVECVPDRVYVGASWNVNDENGVACLYNHAYVAEPCLRFVV